MNRTFESPFLDAELTPSTEPGLDQRATTLVAESPFIDAFSSSEDAESDSAHAEDDFAGESAETSYELDVAMPDQPGIESEEPPPLPAAATDALDKRDWPRALTLAIRDGVRDHNLLTNRLFFARHQELPYGPLDKKHARFRSLSLEWVRIRDKEVWPAIVASAANRELAVSGEQAASKHRVFWASGGERFKGLVEKAALEVDLNPGLLAAVLLSETGMSAYLARHKISSYLVGVDDFYESRGALKAKVPAYSKVRWDSRQKPEAHLNDAKTNPRMVKTILFDSGPDSLLAVAVYLKYREIRLREEAAKRGKSFDALPLETRWALIRGAMAAGVAGITPGLVKALDGEDILVRKNLPPRIYQTYRNATIRVAEALHLSDWVFGIPLKTAPQAQPELPEESEAWEEREDPALERPFEEGELDTRCSSRGHGIIGNDDRLPVRNPTEIPCRFICQLWIRQLNSNGKVTVSGATGTLISPRHVLTAAHVLLNEDTDDRGQWVRTEATEVRVSPARDGADRPFGTVRATLPARIAPQWSPRVKNPGFDYALLTLERPIGAEAFKRLGGRKLWYWGSRTGGGGTTVGGARPEALEARTATTAGYPNDRGGNESPYITRGQLSRLDARLRHMYISADACEGQSGSPVWITVNGRHCMVGMMVKVLERSNVALRISDEVCRQLRTWLKGASDICSQGTSPRPQPELEATAARAVCRCHERPIDETRGERETGQFEGLDDWAMGAEAQEEAQEEEQEQETEEQDGEQYGEEQADEAWSEFGSDAEASLEEAADFESLSEEERRLDPVLLDIAERVIARETGLDPEEQVATAHWTSCFDSADLARVRQAYRDNDAAAQANSIDRCSCIVMLNVALGALLQVPTKDARARGTSTRRVQMAALTTETIEKAMAQLRKLGFARRPIVVDFFDRRNKTAGTLKPERLKSSIQAKVLAAAKSANCCLAFALSLMDGYHSVLLIVDTRGASPRIFWLDQFSSDLSDDVTSTLDQKITDATRDYWQGVFDRKKKGYNTMVRLWPLRKQK